MAKSNASKSKAPAVPAAPKAPAKPAPSVAAVAPPLAFAEIRELVQLVSQLGLDEVTIRNPHQVVKVVGKRPVVYQTAAVAAPAAAAASGPAPAPPAAATAPAVAAPVGETPAAPPPAPASNPNWKRITAPMVGTFYRAASPEAGPFVQVGDRVDEESVLCIIEAMKLMNEIKAEMRGTVREICAENGRPVEYGQPMFIIEPA